MIVVWLPEARDDVVRLHRFLVERGALRPAVRAVRLLRSAAERLASHPLGGRRADDESERRQLILPFGAGSYVLSYRIVGNELLIMRVWHNREVRM